MPKMIVSIDGVVIKEVQLTKDRMTLGRRPYNDIVIDNLAVSGEHAVIQMVGTEVFLEDLNSTNGTYINGKAVKKQLLQNNDTVEIGKYKIRFQGDQASVNTEKTMVYRPGTPAPTPAPPTPAAPATPTTDAHQTGAIRVLNGAAAGREVALVKVVTTIGKPGISVAAITRRPHGFVVAHVDGSESPMLNGSPIQAEPVVLKNGDLLELAGIQMQFVLT
jgi:pSer/pThr/pTyr-binding forkhead associated (FHA) protein